MQKVEEKKKEAFVFADAVKNAPHVPPTCSLWYISELLDWIVFFLYLGLLFVPNEVNFDFHGSILLGSVAMYALWGITELRMQWKWTAYKNVLSEWVYNNYMAPSDHVTVVSIPQRNYLHLMFNFRWVFVILSGFTASFYGVFTGIVIILTNTVARTIHFKCTEYGTIEEAMVEVIEEDY